MKVLVLSRNPALYSTQSIVMAGRRRGHNVRVIDHMYCDLRIERNNLTVSYFGEKLQGIDAIVPRIGASATDYGAAVIRQFELMKIFSTLNSESLLKSRDKLKCLQILAAEGLYVPISAMTNNLQAVGQLIEEVGSLPMVIKLLVSTQGLGVILARDKMTANSVLEGFHRLKQKSMLQEYIAEAKGSDIRVFIVNGEIVASMKRTAVEGDFRSNLHRGGQSVPVKLTGNEEAIARRAAKILGLDIAGVDILRSERGPLLLEVNASPGLEGIETTSGVDISNKIFQYIERRCRNL